MLFLQATALRLQQEKMQRQRGLEEAAFRVEHGQAPSEEVVKEFGRAEKKKGFLLEAAQRREEELSTALMSSGMLKTAAEVTRTTTHLWLRLLGRVG